MDLKSSLDAQECLRQLTNVMPIVRYPTPQNYEIQSTTHCSCCLSGYPLYSLFPTYKSDFTWFPAYANKNIMCSCCFYVISAAFCSGARDFLKLKNSLSDLLLDTDKTSWFYNWVSRLVIDAIK